LRRRQEVRGRDKIEHEYTKRNSENLQKNYSALPGLKGVKFWKIGFFARNFSSRLHYITEADISGVFGRSEIGTIYRGTIS